MNFDFSDDQKQLKYETRRFLERECTPARVRAILDDPSQKHDAALWRAVAAQGWIGSAIPEEFGGLGLQYLELCCLAEELGRVLAPIPFASTVYLFTEALLLAGSAAQKKKYLPKIATGEMIGAFATSEKPGPVNPTSISAIAENGKLTGCKIPVTDGEIADAAVVLANEAGRPALFVVDLTGAGISRERLVTVDPSRNAAKITFSGALVERLGGAGEGFD
jgi:alkylation response protein AidB-like acyl-CoA dehydrogenase